MPPDEYKVVGLTPSVITIFEAIFGSLLSFLITSIILYHFYRNRIKQED